MGLFEKIFGSRKERIQANEYFKMLNAYSPVFNTWNGKIYESGLVRAAIHAKASHVSKMSVKMRGSAKPTLQTRMKNAPNEFQTWSQFLYRLSTILDMNTTAYIVPVVDQYGETTGIYCILPQSVTVVQYENKPYFRFQFANGNVATVEMENCGVLNKFQYKHDFMGDGNGALDQTMQLINIQNQGIMEGVKNAASYRFMAQYANVAFTDDLEAEQMRFNQSVAKKGGTAILFPKTYENIQQVTNKPFVLDADTVKAIEENVYSYFGVNAKIMQNSANADELDAFYNGELEPFAIQFSEVLTKMLFTLREQAQGNKIVVTSDRLQYMSVQNKVNLIQTLGDRGMLTINEARELLNYAPVENGDAMMPIRGEYYNAKESEETTVGEE